MVIELSNRVIQAEQDLLKIKANQKTQNDSNLLYVYRTQPPHISEGQGQWVRYEFIPAKGTYDNVICQFNVSAGYAVQYMETISTYGNPYVAYSQSFWADDWSELPSFLNWAYVWCYTNVAGELRATIVNNIGD